MQRIYAHRGASGYAPENTLEAFALAAELGADGVELDVHLSRDGELVVIHDETIDRVAGEPGVVREMTVAQLKRYTVGQGMDGYADARIPTLREVYELLAPTRLGVNVEIKTDESFYPGIEEKCVALAARMGMTERVLYSSFNHYTLLRIKALDKALPCGLLYSATMVRPWEYAASLGMEALHPHMSQLLVPDIVDDAHAHGVQVNPWTVNDERHLRRVLATGADVTITNYPDLARTVLESL